jgi:hypothetical protein
LNGNLFQIHIMVDRFAAAIALAEYSAPNAAEEKGAPHLYRNFWRNFAGRDGALTIFDFSKTLAAIRGSLNEVPTLLPLIDTGKLKVAEKLFKSQFPSFDLIRHGAAHPGEIFADTNATETNAIKGEHQTPIGTLAAMDGGRILLGGNFFNDTYSIMIEQKIVGYELTADTLAKLERVGGMIYDAFTRAQR